jgi:hypothetical protein
MKIELVHKEWFGLFKERVRRLTDVLVFLSSYTYGHHGSLGRKSLCSRDEAYGNVLIVNIDQYSIIAMDAIRTLNGKSSYTIMIIACTITAFDMQRPSSGCYLLHCGGREIAITGVIDLYQYSIGQYFDAIGSRSEVFIILVIRWHQSPTISQIIHIMIGYRLSV